MMLTEKLYAKSEGILRQDVIPRVRVILYDQVLWSTNKTIFMVPLNLYGGAYGV